MKIDKYARYQKDLSIVDLYPVRTDGLCACGCDKELTGRRRRWATEECHNKALDEFWILKGDMRVIRRILYDKEKGVCQQCGEDNAHSSWEADHIIPVSKGGGGLGMENYQTLCHKCNRSKSNKYSVKRKNKFIQEKML